VIADVQVVRESAEIDLTLETQDIDCAVGSQADNKSVAVSDDTVVQLLDKSLLARVPSSSSTVRMKLVSTGRLHHDAILSCPPFRLLILPDYFSEQFTLVNVRVDINWAVSMNNPIY